MALFYVLGLGVDPAQHATVETLQAAGACDAVYCAGLDRRQREFLARFLAPGAALIEARGAEGEAARNIGAKLSQGKTVGLATPAHPFYWNGLAGRIVGECVKGGVPWQTFGAVSAMGLAISKVGLTLGTDIFGLQSFDAAALAARPVVLNPEWPVVIYFYAPLAPKDYDRTLKALGAFFPAAHEAYWCSTADILKTSVGALISGAKRDFRKLVPSTVLFLPAKAAGASPLESSGSAESKVPVPRAPEWIRG